MIEPTLVAEDGASVDGAADTDEAQGAAEPADAADLSTGPEADQSTHS
jgi:hypothetical protein